MLESCQCGGPLSKRKIEQPKMAKEYKHNQRWLVEGLNIDQSFDIIKL